MRRPQHRRVGRFGASASNFPLAPFWACTVSIGSDPVLTSHVDTELPEVVAGRHAVRIIGRRTAERTVNCTPDVEDGRFAEYTLGAIARAGSRRKVYSSTWPVTVVVIARPVPGPGLATSMWPVLPPPTTVRNAPPRTTQ